MYKTPKNTTPQYKYMYKISPKHNVTISGGCVQNIPLTKNISFLPQSLSGHLHISELKKEPFRYKWNRDGSSKIQHVTAIVLYWYCYRSSVDGSAWLSSQNRTTSQYQSGSSTAALCMKKRRFNREKITNLLSSELNNRGRRRMYRRGW